jgi:hypothetical protein
MARTIDAKNLHITYAELLQLNGTFSAESAHTMLDAAGLVPVIGELADGANAVFYVLEGDLQNASFSAISMVPIVGDALGKGTKYTIKATKFFKVGERVFQSAKQSALYEIMYKAYGNSSKIADAIWDAGRGGANKLAKALGTKGTGKIAHHIIPVGVLTDNKVVQEAIEEGFDFNGIINGIGLDKAFHPTNHFDYSEGVNKLIDATREAFPDLSSKEVVEKVATQLKTIISDAAGKAEGTINDVLKEKF